MHLKLKPPLQVTLRCKPKAKLFPPAYGDVEGQWFHNEQPLDADDDRVKILTDRLIMGHYSHSFHWIFDSFKLHHSKLLSMIN